MPAPPDGCIIRPGSPSRSLRQRRRQPPPPASGLQAPRRTSTPHDARAPHPPDTITGCYAFCLLLLLACIPIPAT